ncbi:MAG: SAM hydrolase/SAM-dependent halogenase family protein [Myxococcota bacterium]
MHPGFSPSGLVTLTTDFGTGDGYVGAMKGVALSVGPDLRLVDAAHDVPPQDVVRGAMALRASAPWFPEGTVHLGVVDPGVGTARAPVVVLAGGHAFVGPDNGLFGPAAEALGGVEGAWRIERHPAVGREVSSTFHGRDVFAPAAAALAAGRLRPWDAGESMEPMTLDLSAPERLSGGGLRGRVLFADHFGNLVTNVTVADLEQVGGSPRVSLPDDRVVPFARTYGDVEAGRPLALLGSEGRLEIAVRDGSAGRALGLGPGAEITVVPRD